MARHHAHVHIQELDLSKSGHTNTIAERMNTVPGFKTSAAFFTFLRANLVLPPTTLNSTSSTPLLDASSSLTLPPLSFPTSSLATMSTTDDLPPPADPLADIPPLTTTTLTSESDKVAALKLIADSVAQQRQFASRAIIFHPITIAVYIGIMAITTQFFYKTRGDIGLVATTCAGVTMVCLVAIRGIAGGYLELAEQMNWKFAENEDGEPDVIIGSRFGDEIIGAAILRLERNKKGKRNGKSGGKGIVRAWTVRIRYRGKGVGTELLEEAVRVTREKLGGSAEIGFAAEHANSKMVLPELFNGGFRKREAKAAKLLETVVASFEGGKKKR